MIPFLKALANEYSSHYNDLSEFLFVFPNKRSATFFLKYLKDNCIRPIIAPETITISSLLEKCSGYVVDNRTDLLFLLYNSYIHLNPEIKQSFDSFRSWGDVVLSDFNDVDMYYVDPESIFKNVRDFKSIQTDFLTDDQRKVMEEYFGVIDSKPHHERFWKNFDYLSESENKRMTDVKNKFVLLWSSLYPLYIALNESLDKEGLAYSGKTYRKAYEIIKQQGKKAFDCNKIVFAGFNALTKIEWLIFSELKNYSTTINNKEESFCDFIWDFSGKFLSEGNSAGKFLTKNIRQFPKPEWLNLSECDASGSLPEIEVIASPSNSFQAKITGNILGDLTGQKDKSNISNAKVAVVLPDENLLMPVLHSLPKTISTVNLTMGYPLKHTSCYTYIECIKRLQFKKQRSEEGVWKYNFEDVKILFSHPFIHIITGLRNIASLKGYINNLRKYWLTADEIARFSPNTTCIFEPVTSDSSADQTIMYIDTALQLAKDHIIKEGNNSLVKPNIDLANIEAFSNALKRLSDSIATRKIEVKYKSIFALTAKLLASEKVNFVGEPLQGLQIMGLLETRCLDFEYVIIPSMNEKIFPKRLRSKSFIPNSLRTAYGMASSSYQESIFSYYFYRLITRARKAWLLYDSRSGDNQAGEPSRYILQLKHLYKPAKLNFRESHFTITGIRNDDIIVNKDAEIMAELERYRNDDFKKNFSASALNKYLHCSLSFYLERIIGIDAESEPTEEIDAISQGNIIHNAMMEVYLRPEQYNKKTEGIIIDRPTIDALLKDEKRLRKIIETNIIKEYYNDPDVLKNKILQVMGEMLYKQFRNILIYDRSLTPFCLYGCEIKAHIKYPLSDGTSVNMTYAIDRLDSIKDNKTGKEIFRIVDYKTGKVYLTADNYAEMFNGEYSSKHFFQLQLYANLLNLTTNGYLQGDNEKSVQLRIYDVSKLLLPSKKQSQFPVLEGNVVELHNSADGKNEEFLSLLDSKIREIMDINTPFVSAKDPSKCTFCNLKAICGR